MLWLPTPCLQSGPTPRGRAFSEAKTGERTLPASARGIISLGRISGDASSRMEREVQRWTGGGCGFVSPADAQGPQLYFRPVLIQRSIQQLIYIHSVIVDLIQFKGFDRKVKLMLTHILQPNLGPSIIQLPDATDPFFIPSRFSTISECRRPNPPLLAGLDGPWAACAMSTATGGAVLNRRTGS